MRPESSENNYRDISYFEKNTQPSQDNQSLLLDNENLMFLNKVYLLHI